MITDTLPEAAASILNDAGFDVVPEAYREGRISLFMTGGESRRSGYISGGVRLSSPFELRVRADGSVADRLRKIGLLSSASDYLRGYCGELTFEITGYPAKAAVLENGGEEYRIQACACRVV